MTQREQENDLNKERIFLLCPAAWPYSVGFLTAVHKRPWAATAGGGTGHRPCLRGKAAETGFRSRFRWLHSARAPQLWRVLSVKKKALRRAPPRFSRIFWVHVSWLSCGGCIMGSARVARSRSGSGRVRDLLERMRNR